MDEPLRIEISLVKPDEWRVVERSHLAAESVARVVFREAELSELMAEINQCLIDANISAESQRVRLCRLGGRLAEIVLPNSLREKISSTSSRVEFFLDDASVRLPVELFPNAGTVLGESTPVSRHWLCENIVITAQVHMDKTKEILIVADPSENLPGAQEEGQELFRKLRSFGKNCHCRFLGRAVTVAELAKELPQTDLLHIAGHYISGGSESDSGIVMADGLWMPSPSSHAPTLAFVNCCRAGLTFDDGGLSLVGRLLRQGAEHVVAPYLPVSDQIAKHFAELFYHSLLSEGDVALAMWKARKAIGSAGWMYWHFGALTESRKQFMPRRRRSLMLVPLALMIGFLVLWYVFFSQSNHHIENAVGTVGMNNATVSSGVPQKTLDDKKNDFRIAPDAGREF